MHLDVDYVLIQSKHYYTMYLKAKQIIICNGGSTSINKCILFAVYKCLRCLFG